MTGGGALEVPPESGTRPGRAAAPRLALLALLVLGLFTLDLVLGSVSIPIHDVVETLVGGEPDNPAHGVILRQLRLPRALTALLAGAALAVAGLLMQTLFRNPLAGPYVLGLSAGASLGVAIIVLGTGGLGGFLGVAATGPGGMASPLLGDLGKVTAASLGAGAVLALVLLAARRVSTLTLLILGVLFGYAVTALVTVLLHFSLAERIQAYLAWTFGSFGGVAWGQLGLFAPLLGLGLALALGVAKPLNALALGEDEARGLGVRLHGVKVWVLLATALLSGVVTAFCGPIGFLGIAVPHLARGLLGRADHRLLIPASALAGAGLALLADMVSQLPGRQAVLPLNAVMALLGAPIIVFIILRRRGLDGFG